MRRDAVQVHVVVPAGFDDPGRPSGGNVYDQKVCAGLAAAGWDVRVCAVTAAGLGGALAALPDGSGVLIDGLLASPAAAQLLPHAGRLRLTVLLHMPLATAHGPAAGDAARCSERAVLGAAAAVVVPSQWTRRQVVSRCAVPPGRVHVALPGTDPPALPARPVPGRLACVGVLGPHKGQDVLVAALGMLAGAGAGAGGRCPDWHGLRWHCLSWHCVLAGPDDADPEFTAALREQIARAGLAGRVELAGVLAGTELAGLYASADLLVAPSRSETYGMAAAEALAHGVPVIAADTGGLPEALGRAADGSIPGELVPPGDPAALAAALARWLADGAYRDALRAAAAQRRAAARGWEHATRAVARALTAAAR